MRANIKSVWKIKEIFLCNRIFFPHTLILTKNVFLVTLKAKYQNVHAWEKNLPAVSAHWMLPGQTNNLLVSFSSGETLCSYAMIFCPTCNFLGIRKLGMKTLPGGQNCHQVFYTLRSDPESEIESCEEFQIIIFCKT